MELWDVLANRLRAPPGPGWKFADCRAISPDGRAVAQQTADPRRASVGDEDVTVWDVETGNIRWIGAHAASIKCVEYSPDGATLAVACGDGTVHLWDHAGGTEKLVLMAQAVTSKTMHVSMAFTPDGRTLAWANTPFPPHTAAPGEPPGWEAKVWDATTGEERWCCHGATGGVEAVAASADGSLVAAAGTESVGRRAVATVRLWDLATGQERLLLRGRGETYQSVAFTPDGKSLAAGGGVFEYLPGDADLWDVPTGQLRASLRGHPDLVNFVAFTPDGNTLISASEDGTAKVWDATPLAPVPEPARE